MRLWSDSFEHRHRLPAEFEPGDPPAIFVYEVNRVQKLRLEARLLYRQVGPAHAAIRRSRDDAYALACVSRIVHVPCDKDYARRDGRNRGVKRDQGVYVWHIGRSHAILSDPSGRYSGRLVSVLLIAVFCCLATS